MLLCHSHCDLDLYPTDPRIDRKHLLSMTNYVCMKFEKAEPNQTLVIDQRRLYMTDGQTVRQVQSKMPPLLQRGGGGKYKENHGRMHFPYSSILFYHLIRRALPNNKV